MTLDNDKISMIADQCYRVIEENTRLLTSLDQAVGDGDHGLNMVRGFRALREVAAAGEFADYGQACKALGMALVMNVGGASGPLYGSLLMDMGKASAEFPDSVEALHQSFSAGVEAVKKRGKSSAGEKTMLDVLVPVCDLLASGEASVADIRKAAQAGLDSTRLMRATKGRSAFLGARSVGHIDPGAQSSYLLINAICDAMENQNEP